MRTGILVTVLLLLGSASPTQASWLKPGWTLAYADAARRLDAVLPFKALSRADLLLRDGEVAALRDAGCETVWMGAESGSQLILDAMDKGTRVGTAVTVIQSGKPNRLRPSSASSQRWSSM